MGRCNCRRAQAGEDELVAQISIGETVHRVFAAHHGGEELSVGSGQGIEDLDGSRRGRLLAGRNLVQGLQGDRRIVDCGQGVQVPGVALERDLTVPEEVGNALPQGNPCADAVTTAADAAAHAKFLRLVDHRLDLEDEPGFLVHLEPVLFHPMFDPAPRQTASQRWVESIRDEISFEFPMELTAQE